MKCHYHCQPGLPYLINSQALFQCVHCRLVAIKQMAYLNAKELKISRCTLFVVDGMTFVVNFHSVVSVDCSVECTGVVDCSFNLCFMFGVTH